MFGLKAAKETLRQAGEEITALNKENRKYLNEIQRLRAAFRINMLRLGAEDAEIDGVLKNMCKE